MRKGKVINLLIDLIFSAPKRRQYFHAYNKDWDATLNRIIDQGIFKTSDPYCAKFIYNDVSYSIWIGNYPYNYGHAEEIDNEIVPSSLRFRASDRTMTKLREFLEAPYLADERRREERMRKYITGKD